MSGFIPVTLFGGTAELFLKYVAIGDAVHLSGRADSTNWKDAGGKSRLTLSIIIEQIQLLPNARREPERKEARQC